MIDPRIVMVESDWERRNTVFIKANIKQKQNKIKNIIEPYSKRMYEEMVVLINE